MFVYMAGPLSPKDGYTLEQNVRAAAGIYFQLIAENVDAFCPHLGATFERAFDITYERWMEYDFAIIHMSTHVLMLPRWETSPGAVREHELALKLGKTINYWPERPVKGAKL